MNETLKRSLSGAVYIGLLIGCLLYSRESFLVLFGIFLLISVWEFCALVSLHRALPLLLAGSLYGVSAWFLLSKTPFDNRFYYSVLGISLASCLMLFQFLFTKKEWNATPLFRYTSLIGYLIGPFLLMARIPIYGDTYAFRIIIGYFIIIWTNDTFAYLVGKSIGKHKLFERISPKKTIEGFLGGLFFSLLAAYLITRFLIHPVPSVFNERWLQWTFTALILSVFGTIGDLVESKFKRLAGVKDSGRIMPGHGGVLDRLDSIIFATPFVYLFYQILDYVLQIP
ncbi:MAG TPA: phosphatidate cytidylyltransferase [Flavobacterium sp.]|nr:phosphatidate cytidylyltransferase [Flavobacterium sp.]